MKLLQEMRESEPNISGDGTELAPIIIKDIKHLIRKGAKDLSQKWKDAVHLVKKAYDVAGHELPRLTQKDAWIQYEHLIGFAVKELAKNRGFKGPNADWRSTDASEKYKDNSIIPKNKLPMPLGTVFKDS